MTQDHADQIVDYLSGLFRPPDQQLTRNVWREQLMRLEDPRLTMQAVINGAQVWTRFPSWHDLLVELRSLQERRKVMNAISVTSCATCDDTGLVLALMRFDPARLDQIKRGEAKPGERRGPFEEWAPCPYCEAGKKLEGVLYGEDGFWQGRDTSYVRPVREEREKEQEKPAWVEHWEAARDAEDMRPFPEQYEALTAEERPKKPLTDRSAWVQEEEYSYAGEGLA